MVDFVPAERSTTIRQPSTANLMVASQDRRNWNFTGLTNPFNFQITRSNSILNGFFTRIGTTELVLNWFQPNIYDASNNPFGTLTSTNNFSVDISGGPHDGVVPITLPVGFYTAKQVIDCIVKELNAATAPGVFSVNTTLCTGVSIDISGATYSIQGGSELPWMLGVIPYGQQNTAYATSHIITKPDIRPLEYIDFVSSQLTYNQALKDSSTNQNIKDVLARWYFAYDQPPQVDAYGFPILMGYTPFVLRRTFSPAKQIRWDSQQPVGNIAFECYATTTYTYGITYQPLVLADNETNWLMTLQVSEV